MRIHATAKNLLRRLREPRGELSMKHVAGLALALGIALAPSAVPAQDAWPNRAITFIVPYAPGGYTDLVGRLTARYVEKALGKSVVVDNRAGRRRHRRDAGGRDRAARRLHVLRLQRRRRLDCAVRPEGRLRSGAGPGAGRHRQLDRAGGHRQEGPAGEDDGRARRPTPRPIPASSTTAPAAPAA